MMSKQRAPTLRIPVKRSARCRNRPLVVGAPKIVKGIQNLPDELLLQIFSHLSHVEVIRSVPKVCKRWWRLHRDPSLYRKFIFNTDEHMCTEFALNMLRRAPWLNTLYLINRLDTNELLAQVIISQKRIKRLVFRECSGDYARNYNIKYLLQKQMLRQCKRIEFLKVKQTSFSKKFYDGIGVALPQLRNIQFSATKKSNTEAIRGIMQNCKHLEELRAFAVFDNPRFGRTTNNDISTMSDRASNSLTVLKLNGAEWTNAAIESLARCRNLKRLHIYHAAKITGNGILKLIDLKHLQFLTLVNCRHISSRAWVKLFESDSMKRLKSLSLAMCSNITDKVVQTIGRKLGTLKKLRLTGCTLVTDVGFLDLIAGCSQVTFLNAYLMNPVIGKVFPLLPIHLPDLTTLIYDPVDLNSELCDILEEIFVKLPNLNFRVGNTCWKNNL